MSNQLAGKVIIVAGGGGIGDELARWYVADGASVVLGDINGEAAAAAAHKADPSGARAVGVRLDGAEEDSIDAAVQLALTKFGRLNGLHANFASFADGHLTEGVVDMPLEAFNESVRVNLGGYLLCTRVAVPAMIAGGGGSIVYTSSTSAYIGEPVRPAYAASKAATHALMRHVARRYGPEGIRANVIAPGGLIMHAGLAASISEEFQAYMREQTALRSRLGRPEDIAALGALLLSDNSGYITGQVIAVDGGSTMRP